MQVELLLFGTLLTD